MLTIKPRTLAIICAACLFVGWVDARRSPRSPLSERPVAWALSRLAKCGLWVMLAAESPPTDPAPQFVHARHPEIHELRHGAGW